jgi:glycosyltransferase involved in cell wall biosynthesis
MTEARPATDTPKVTALVPCYNSAAFVSKTLDSLAAQTWPNLEILIADDASTDGTLAVLEAFAAGRDNVRVIAREANLGWLRNTNDLMRRVDGPFMFFAFHDDLVAPTYVEKLVTALGANPRAILAYSDMETVEPDGGERTLWVNERLLDRPVRERGMIMARRPRGWWVPNRGVFRSEAFGLIGGLKPHAGGEVSADWVWMLHMALLGEFVRVPEVLCEKFFKEQSLSRSWKFIEARERGLRRAGMREVMASRIGLADKAAILWALSRMERRRPLVWARRKLGAPAGRA